MFINYYFCHECGTSWCDESDSQCDDRCPVCNTPNSPEFSEEVEEKADGSYTRND